jgi:hypothetical protein
MLSEKEQSERKRVAGEAEAEIIAIEQCVPTWLDTTREPGRLSGLEHLSFEAGQIAAFLSKIAGECEIGLAFALPDLKIRRLASRTAPDRATKP